MSSAIAVKDVVAGYGQTIVLDGISLDVEEGGTLALLGRNGVGKTTLLEIIVGEQRAESGEVHVGKETRIGYLPQELTEQVHGSVID